MSTHSDGSTASYYEIPEGAKELYDLIIHRNMNHQIGEIFCACYRNGLASHSDKLRDAKKIKLYAEVEIKRLGGIGPRGDTLVKAEESPMNNDKEGPIEKPEWKERLSEKSEPELAASLEVRIKQRAEIIRILHDAKHIRVQDLRRVVALRMVIDEITFFKILIALAAEGMISIKDDILSLRDK